MIFLFFTCFKSPECHSWFTAAWKQFSPWYFTGEVQLNKSILVWRLDALAVHHFLCLESWSCFFMNLNISQSRSEKIIIACNQNSITFHLCLTYNYNSSFPTSTFYLLSYNGCFSFSHFSATSSTFLAFFLSSFLILPTSSYPAWIAVQ